jgi:hypothetical protein
MPEVFNAPQQLVYPASALMALSGQEISQCFANGPVLGAAHRCEVPLNIGVFFDGTNNNAKRDEPERLHTNVVRLFNAHPDVKAAHHLERPGHYRIYIPGVGTPFDANAEVRESREGKAFGKGGQARILYAVIQTLNAAYRACQREQNLYDESDIADMLMHSQGRSPGEGGLLSQIPLIHMHKAARAAGVPLLDHLLMEGQDELIKDYALERDLVACWNVYMAKADADHRAQQAGRGVAQEHIQPLAECRSREVLVRQHMRLYYDFRRRCLGERPGHRPEFWHYPQARPSDQDGDDIDSYNALLMGDLHLLDNRKPQLPCNQVLLRLIENLQYMRYRGEDSAPEQASRARDVAWINWALNVMRGDDRVGGSDHVWLLGRYMHDSLAGFCLLGPGSREEKSEKLLELVEKKARGEPLNAYEASVVKNYEEKSRTNAALKKAIQKRIDDRSEIQNTMLTPRTSVASNRR